MKLARSSIALACVLAAACVPACGKSSSSSIDPTDAGGGDAGDGAIPCMGSGVSKGPWVLAVNGTSAKIRWEACRASTAAGVTIAREDGAADGGVPTHVDAIESPFTVTSTYTAPFNPNATPDYAGVWYMHEAPVSGLAPATCYTYALDADASAKGRFCTSRASGDTFRFMSIGDTNALLGDSTANVLRHVLPKNPDFVVHGGDIEYYASTLETWAAWFPVMNPMLRQGAFYPAIGNHEDERQNPDELRQYSLRFFGGAGFDGTNGYYRFESGGVWFFSVDTETSIDASSEQGQWLVASLADASTKPGYRFSVVFMHRPMLSCGDVSDAFGAVQYYTPIFKQYKVPLVIQAHMHGYERIEHDGVVYVTSAGGGGALGNVDENVSRAYCSSERKSSGAFFFAVDFRVDAAGVTGTTIDDQGAVRDTFSIAAP